MKEKSLKNLIEELRHAQHYHCKRANDLSLPKKDRDRDKKMVDQKEEIIEAIKGKIPVVEEHFKLVKKWRKNHLEWIKYLAHQHILKLENKLSSGEVKELEKDEREGGTINHDLRWVRNYSWVLYYLEKQRSGKEEFTEKLWQ